MKYILNILIISLVVIWFIIFWSSNSFQTIDLLIVLSAIILLIRIMFNNQLTKEKKTDKTSETTVN